MIYPRILLGDLDLTAAPFMWEFGSDFGGPEVVYETLLSMLRDGSSVSSAKADNRTMTLPVLIEAADFLSLALYEALLVAECDKPRNTLTFEPGDAFGPPSVFDTFRASAVLQRSDDEEQQFVRRWVVTLQAFPWPRSADETVTPAQPSTPTYAVVDNGSSTTGWSIGGFGVPGGTTLSGPTVVSGRVTETVSGGGGGLFTMALFRTGAISLAAYIVIDFVYLGSPTTAPTLQLNGGGPTLGPSAQDVLGVGAVRYYYAIPAGVTAITDINVRALGLWTSGNTISIDQVRTSDAIPFIGSAKQNVASLVPGGSVRTQGSLAVQHASSALGSTLVYTYPAGLGWTPPLRPWLFSSATVSSDSTAVSGSKQLISTTATFYQVPASILPPGSYLVMARLKVAAAATVPIGFSSDVYLSGNLVGHEEHSTDVVFASTAYELHTLGRLSLPTMRVGPAGNVQIGIVRGAGSATVTLDEVYLFHESGDLTVVECGTASPAAGAASNRLWIDAPSLDDPQSSVWVGHAADRSDAHHAGSACTARPPYGHNLAPDGMNVFTVTSNADSPEVSSTHYKRWHSHAAE